MTKQELKFISELLTLIKPESKMSENMTVALVISEYLKNIYLTSS